MSTQHVSSRSSISVFNLYMHNSDSRCTDADLHSADGKNKVVCTASACLVQVCFIRHSHTLLMLRCDLER